MNRPGTRPTAPVAPVVLDPREAMVRAEERGRFLSWLLDNGYPDAAVDYGREEYAR